MVRGGSGWLGVAMGVSPCRTPHRTGVPRAGDGWRWSPALAAFAHWIGLHTHRLPRSRNPWPSRTRQGLAGGARGWRTLDRPALGRGLAGVRGGGAPLTVPPSAGAGQGGTPPAHPGTLSPTGQGGRGWPGWHTPGTPGTLSPTGQGGRGWPGWHPRHTPAPRRTASHRTAQHGLATYEAPSDRRTASCNCR